MAKIGYRGCPPGASAMLTMSWRRSSRTGRVVRRQFRDAFLELMQRPIEMAEAFELAHRLREILPAMATPANPLQDEPSRLVDREAPGIARMAAAHGERESLLRPARREQAHGTAIIDATRHFALPEIVDRARGPGRGNADRHAAAGAAAIETEHQSRPFGRAAIAARVVAEAAVPAAQHRRLDRVMGKTGIPHQRAIGEDPDVLALRELRCDLGRERRDLLDGIAIFVIVEATC